MLGSRVATLDLNILAPREVPVPKERKEVWTELQAERYLQRHLPVARSGLARDPEGASRLARKLGYPCVLKLSSPDIIHKTEFGGVKLVHDEDELRLRFAELTAKARKARARLDGILVQEFVEGTELIIGITRDPAFGHVLAFGLGGIYVELLKDVRFRVCPITEDDAQEMIDELKGRTLLYGFRKMPPLNLRLLKQVLVKASRLPERLPRMEEMDLNPFLLGPKTGKVADARIVLA
jgi:succinyl-CoA synthetase beta subunit